MTNLTGVPKAGKACVIHDKGPNYRISLDENYPIPEFGDDELLIKLNCTGICASDTHLILADWGVAVEPDCPGHEGAGVVAAVGKNVKNFNIGDRVGHSPIADVCGECEHCRSGQEVGCAKKIVTARFTNGSYCQYIVRPARYTPRIPDNVPDELAGPILCSGSTIYQGFRKANLRPGDWVVIPGGGGGLGHLCCQMGKVFGVRIIAIDTGKDKEKLCMSYGIERFLDFKEESDLVAKVKKITGGDGAHSVIVVGGSGGAYTQAPEFLRNRGTMVAIGLPPKGTAIAGSDPFTLCTRQLSIVGSYVGTMNDINAAFELCSRGLLVPLSVKYKFEDFPDVVQKLIDGKVVGRSVVFF